MRLSNGLKATLCVAATAAAGVAAVATTAAADGEGPARAAAIRDWKISIRGLGPLRVGQTVDEAEARSGYQLKPSYGSRPCRIWTLVGAPEGISVMTANGKLVRVQISRRPWTTLISLHVGSRESAVRRQYPKARVKAHPYTPGGHYIIADRIKYRMIFETGRRHRVTSIRGGLAKYVNYIEGCA
jgi:hypothetical protein